LGQQRQTGSSLCESHAAKLEEIAPVYQSAAPAEVAHACIVSWAEAAGQAMTKSSAR
jgi:hypothetical protein